MTVESASLEKGRLLTSARHCLPEIREQFRELKLAPKPTKVSQRLKEGEKMKQAFGLFLKDSIVWFSSTDRICDNIIIVQLTQKIMNMCLIFVKKAVCLKVTCSTERFHCVCVCVLVFISILGIFSNLFLFHMHTLLNV